MGRPARKLQLATSSVAQKQEDLITFRSPKYKELQARMEKLQRELDAVHAEERSQAKEAVLHWIKEFEFTAFELGFVKTQIVPAPKVKKSEKTFNTGKGVKVKAAIPPKYRDPATGKTWSGRGHQPGWMTGDRDDWLIDKSAPSENADMFEAQ